MFTGGRCLPAGVTLTQCCCTAKLMGLSMCGSFSFSSAKVKIKCWIQPPVDIWSSGLSTFQFLLGDRVRLFLQTNLNAALIWLHHLPIIAWMAGWYVTVNVTNCSHNCCLGPYQAVLRHSLTPLRFIIPRLARVLGSDSGFCYGFTDKITRKYNPGEKIYIFIKYKSWMFALIQPFVKVLAVSLTCSGSRMAQMWVGGAAAEGTKAQRNVAKF